MDGTAKAYIPHRLLIAPVVTSGLNSASPHSLGSGMRCVCYCWNMKFENDKGQPVEINFQTFGSVLPGAKPGLTPVKLKNGKEEWIKATPDEILEASAEE